MIAVKRIVLDVLKPHRPNILEFAQTIAGQGEGCRVKVTVLEVDEKTETLRVVIEAERVRFGAVQEVIADMGASLQSYLTGRGPIYFEVVSVLLVIYCLNSLLRAST